MEYIMCLDNEYSVDLSNSVAVCDLECMLDSLLDLLKSYRIEDEEILETLKNDTGLEINSMEE